jgi:kinesin family protein 6/9
MISSQNGQENDEGSDKVSSLSASRTSSNSDDLELESTSSEQTTIKIYARIKPQKGGKKSDKYYLEESANGSLPLVGFRVPKDQNQGLINNQKEQHEFKFTRIFDQDAGQEEVFDTVAKEVCDNVLEGYNGTIFAYGMKFELKPRANGIRKDVYDNWRR